MSLRELETVSWNYVRTGFGGHAELVYVEPSEVAAVEPCSAADPIGASNVLNNLSMGEVDAVRQRVETISQRHWSAVTLKNGHKIFIAMRSDLVYEALADGADRTHAPNSIHSLPCGVCNATRHFQNGFCGECGSTRAPSQLHCPKCKSEKDSLWRVCRDDGTRVAFYCTVCKTDIPDAAFR